MKALYPGPWTAHGLTVYTSAPMPPQVIPHDPKRRQIAVAIWDDAEDDETAPWDYAEAQAHATAIAALPDLISALESAIMVFNVKTIDPVQAFVAIEQAKAALAKARGELQP